MTTLFDKLTSIFRDIFEDDGLLINSSTTAADVDGWDSLQHVSLILAVEREFGFRFSSAEVAELQSVGDLLAIVEKRLVTK